MKYAKGSTPRKKQLITKVTILLPQPWVSLIDKKARAECTTRTQIIKSLIIDFCLRRGK